MSIDDQYIEDIFNLKKKAKDKVALSKYDKLIPMYDIYSNQIFPIRNKNVHYRLIDCHYRFVNFEIYNWIKYLYNKYKSNKKLKNVLEKNLKIMDNYDIDILIETSYKTLYQYSPYLGLSVSICKRNSFHSFIEHLNPYYTKTELIKLGQNMKLIKKDIEPETLINEEIHYDVCKKVSNNDISYEEIKEHTLHIINNDIISWLTFYSFYGSFLFNKYLRNEKIINTFLNDGLIKISNAMKKSPTFKNDYYFYRFIHDDSFLKDLKLKEIFIDKGFISTTRDPFYSPVLEGTFGLILIKIYIPKEIGGIGLLCENFSLFQNEEEFILAPNTKLRLVSKDEHFKYYHTNESFERLINKKYEFELLPDKIKIPKLKIVDNTKIINNITDYEGIGYNRFNIIKNFIGDYNKILIKFNKKDYLMTFFWFDTSEKSSYHKLYRNKMKDGIMFSIFENGYPWLNIEIGNELVVNYINQFYYYKDTKTEIDKDTLDLILEFGRIFHFKDAIIYHTIRNFSQHKKTDDIIFNYMRFYNHSIYDYAKNKKKYLDYEFIRYPFGWYNIDSIFNKELDKDIIKKYNLKYNKIKDILIDSIENNFIFYKKLIIILKELKLNINKNSYVIFDIYEKLNSQNRITNFRSDILYNECDKLTDEYDLVFRQPIRRY